MLNVTFDHPLLLVSKNVVNIQPSLTVLRIRAAAYFEWQMLPQSGCPDTTYSLGFITQSSVSTDLH